MPLSPTVVARPPSLESFRHRLNAPSTAERVAGDLRGAIGGVSDILKARRRREILDALEQEGGDGSALSAAIAATGGGGRANRALGEFDETEGVFNRPVFGPGGVGSALPPQFNPDASDPRAGVRGVSPLQGAGEGLERAPAPRRGGGEVDDLVREFERDFAPESALQRRLTERSERATLDQQLGALSDASPEERQLVRSGILTPSQLLNRIDEREAEEAERQLNLQVFERLNRQDPETFPEFIPGIDYAEQFGDERDNAQAVTLERLKQQGRLELTGIREAGRNRRADLRAATSGSGKPGRNLVTAALSLMRGGMSRQQAAETLARSTGTSQLEATDAVIAAGNRRDDLAGEDEPTRQSEILSTADLIKQKAIEKGLTRGEVLDGISRMRVSPEVSDRIVEELESFLAGLPLESEE